MATQSQPYPASTVSSSADSGRTLRRALKANSLFSGLSGALFLLDSTPIAKFLGIHDIQLFNLITGQMLIIELGVGLLAFAGWVIFTATRQPISRASAIAIFVGDVAWVIGSIVLVASRALPLTVEGVWGVLIVADIVLAFAVWEFVGLRRMAKS